MALLFWHTRLQSGKFPLADVMAMLLALTPHGTFIGVSKSLSGEDSGCVQVWNAASGTQWAAISKPSSQT